MLAPAQYEKTKAETDRDEAAEDAAKLQREIKQTKKL